MLYRVKQFWRALFPFVHTSERAYIAQHVPPEARPLFFRQSTAEQRHALDVARELESWSLPLTAKDYEALILAALFHDCGKSLEQIKLWQRVAIVLLEHIPAGLRLRTERIPMVVAAQQIATQHARWGSELAREAGLSPFVCTLIGEHHHPESHLAKLLHKADNLN